MIIQARVIACVLVSLFFAAGCSSHGPHEELLGTSESPIIAGTPISDSTAENDGVVLIKAVQFEPLFNPVLRKTEIGSGSLLTNEWVLTAAHVVDQAASPADIEIRRGNAGDANAQVRRGIRTVIHPTWNRAAIGPNGENLCTSGVGKDVALVKVAPPFTGGTLRDISFDTLATINSGKTTHVAGYGESICDAKNSGTLRTADMQTAQGTAPYFTVLPNVLGQITSEGDSGGPWYGSELCQRRHLGRGKCLRKAMLGFLLRPRGGRVQGLGRPHRVEHLDDRRRLRLRRDCRRCWDLVAQPRNVHGDGAGVDARDDLVHVPRPGAYAPRNQGIRR